MLSIGILKASRLVVTEKWQDRWYCWESRENVQCRHFCQCQSKSFNSASCVGLISAFLGLFHSFPRFTTCIFPCLFTRRSLCWEWKPADQPPILLNETAVLSMVLWASKELIPDAMVSAHRDMTLRFLYKVCEDFSLHSDGNKISPLSWLQ